MNAASVRLLRHFVCEHLPSALAAVSKPCGALAEEMAEALDSPNPTAGAEVTTGLRKLLEAKDCFVRAAVILAHDTEDGHE